MQFNTKTIKNGKTLQILTFFFQMKHFYVIRVPPCAEKSSLK